MPRWQRVYLAMCAGLLGFCLAYALCDYAAWPRLTYFPYERTWGFTRRPPGRVPMNYVGTVLWGLSGGLVGAALVLGPGRLWRAPVPPRGLALAGGWALTAFTLAGAYFTWHLW
jgi:hypothetical protein